MLQTPLKRCTFDSAILPISNRSFMWVPLLLLFWIVNTRAIGKFLQVQQNKFVLAEVALRFWCRFDNFWMWSVFPIYTNKSNFWALEQALIQLWQPQLNTPFIYQFFQLPEGTHFHGPSFQVHASLDSIRCGANYDGSPHLHKYDELYTVLFLVAVFSFGKSFKTSVAIRSRDFTWKNDSAPMRLAQMDVTSFDASPTTWENLNVHTLSMPSTGP